MNRTVLEDLLGNVAKAFLIWMGTLVPAVSSGGSGLPLLMTLMPAIVYLGAAYNVPLRQTMAPSEKRKVAPSATEPVD